MTANFIDITDVTLAYGGGSSTVALRGLSMAATKGSFTAVVGPSGCGKSTLMKLATGLHFPQVGHVEIAGQRVIKPLAIAGMAFQNPTLLPWRTTLENVLLPLEIVAEHRTTYRRRRKEHKARAEALLELVGLKGFGGRYPWELSGGMQQRANLCRALIHQPQLLMLDEPFGALDAFTREELWCVMRDLHAKSEVTVVLVTHDLREATFLADRILVMSARPGRILVDQLIDLPRPRDLDITYTQDFTSIVQDLHGSIALAREAHNASETGQEDSSKAFPPVETA